MFFVDDLKSIRRHWLPVCFMALVLMAILFVYAPVLSAGRFIHDDWYHIEHASQKTLERQLAEFSPIDTESQAIGNLEWWAYWRLFHLNPLPYFVTGVILHAICTLLIFLVSKELGLGFRGGVIAAIWFGLNPALFYTVTWISTATEYPYALVFCMLTLICYLRGVIRPPTVRWIYLIVSVLFYLLAIKAKMQSHFLPFLFLALALGKASMQARSFTTWCKALAKSLLPQLPYWAISLVYIWILFSQGTPGAYRLSFDVLNAVRNFSSYFSFFSSWPGAGMATARAMTTAGLICTGTIVLWGWGFRAIARGSASWARSRGLLWNSYVSWMWGWLAFLPVIFLVQHAYPGHLYLPTAGFALFLGALIERILTVTPWVSRWGVLVALGFWLCLVYPIFTEKLSYLIPVWAKNQATLSSLQSQYPQLPADAHLYIYPFAPGALFDSGSGSSIRLMYRQPVAVTVVGRPEELGKAIGGEPAETVWPSDPRESKFDPGTQELYLLRYDEETGNLENLIGRPVSFNVPAPQEELNLIRMDPEGAAVRKIPDPHLSGHTAVMAYARNITPDTVVVWRETELQTAYCTPMWILAVVPDRFLAEIGECDVFLRNKAGASNKLRFIIKP
jgi:hypothetical protein